VPYGTDAPAFSDLGIPTVVFGPGSIAQAHTADEWIAIEQLNAATEILYEFVRTYSS
jgi:acetylornithine deacetylase